MRVLERLALIAILVLGIGLRIWSGWDRVVEGGVALIRDPDAAYHLRRAEQIAAGFPSLFVHDSFLAHPRGAYVLWPPLWDLLLAAAIEVSPSSAPGTVSPPLALLPPLFFGAALVVVFALARKLWPDRAGPRLIAVLVPAVIPAGLGVFRVGQLDHHAAEVFLTLLLVLALACPPSRRSAVVVGLTFAAALLVQLMSLILIPFAMASALLSPPSGRAQEWRRLATALALAGLVLLPFAWPYHQAGAPFSAAQFGLFQVAAAGVAALVAAAFGELAAGRRARAVLWLAPAAASGAFLVRGAGRGLAFLGGAASPWIAQIGESRSILKMAPATARVEVLGAFSLLVLLIPIGVGVLATRWWRETGSSETLRAIWVFGLAMGGLAALQARFFSHAALFAGFFVAAAAHRFAARLPVALPMAAVLVLAVLPIGGKPSAEWRRIGREEVAFDRARDVLEILSARDRDRPDAKPGVLAEWSYGHFIQYQGAHPAVADNFGDYVGDPTLAAKLLLQDDEGVLLAGLDRASCGYVLVADLASTLSGIALDRGLLARYVAGGALRADRAQVQFTPAIVPTVLYRLAWQNGAGVVAPDESYVPPLAGLRLIAESAGREEIPGRAGGVAWVKLYQRVAGVQILVDGIAPGAEIALVAEVESPRGIRFPFVQPAFADLSGRAELRLPYPSAAVEGESHWVQAEIAYEDSRTPLPEITGQEIDRGRTIPMRLPSGQTSRRRS